MAARDIMLASTYNAQNKVSRCESSLGVVLIRGSVALPPRRRFDIGAVVENGIVDAGRGFGSFGRALGIWYFETLHGLRLERSVDRFIVDLVWCEVVVVRRSTCQCWFNGFEVGY